MARNSLRLWKPHENGNCISLTEIKCVFLGAGPWTPRCYCPDAAPEATEHTKGRETDVSGSQGAQLHEAKCSFKRSPPQLEGRPQLSDRLL